ncbi:MAG TPA: SPOR domain-containing protein [Candidatus Dormibacteraeota bacterium]|nr:SPOR domain-containing protein [Candidatus Dormibacteraeota bacterium]
MLEGRHVIGLFMLMLLFSGVFFTLGYVMGRNQYDGQVRAATTGRSAFDEIVAKPNAAAKHAQKTPATGQPTETVAPPNSDWEFYNAGKPKTTEDHLKPAESASSHKAVPAVAKNDSPAAPVATSSKSAAPSKSMSGPLIPGGAYTLQVAALTKEADALDLASRLQKKKFPAVVLTPQGDKFYRVQVGPYADPKSADAAKKGLEAEGFKAFVKH